MTDSALFPCAGSGGNKGLSVVQYFPPFFPFPLAHCYSDRAINALLVLTFYSVLLFLDRQTDGRQRRDVSPQNDLILSLFFLNLILLVSPYFPQWLSISFPLPLAFRVPAHITEGHQTRVGGRVGRRLLA